MTTLEANSYTYNPITGGTSSIPWVYYYVSGISNSDSDSYVYTWTNSTGVTIPSVYIVIVGEGGLGLSSFTFGASPGCGGSGGAGGGQVSLFQFNNVEPSDFIQVNYSINLNTYSVSTSFCNLTYFRNSVAQDLTQIGAYYYNTPDYDTGTTLSTITFSINNFLPISSGAINDLLYNVNNTNIKIFYGSQGEKGTINASNNTGSGGNGGRGGGGSGGGGGQYTYAGVAGSNGSRGTQNYNLETYGGMKGGTSDSSDCRDGGYTPLCMPDGTGTSSLPAGALLGNAGSGNCGSDSGTSSAGESGAPGSIMVFYPTN